MFLIKTGKGIPEISVGKVAASVAVIGSALGFEHIYEKRADGCVIICASVSRVRPPGRDDKKIEKQKERKKTTLKI